MRLFLSPRNRLLIIGCTLTLSSGHSGQATAQSSAKADPLETIVVTDKKFSDDPATEQRLTPGGLSIVDGDAAYQRNVSNMADLLRYVPGLWIESSSGTDEVFFSSRGSNLDATNYDGNGIKLLQDGLPVTTADGNNHNRALDPMSARSAVVARGANALTYGASTLGGAIDFTSPTARNSAPLALFLNGGSDGRVGGRLTAGRMSGAFDGLVSVEAQDWDGYRDHSEQDRRGVYANAGWQATSALSTRLFVTYVDNDQQLPGALSRAQFQADPDQASATALGGNFQKNVETWRLASKTTWAINATSSLEFGLSYEAQSLYHPIVDQVLVDFDGPGPQTPVEVFSLLVDTDHRDLGTMLRYHVQLGTHDVVAGVHFGDGSVEGGNFRNLRGRRNGLSERVDNDSDSLAAFVVDRWRFADKWTLVYGAQFVNAHRDVNTTDAASGAVRNPKDTYTDGTPRVGLIYSLDSDSEFFASVSRLFEAPTTFELENDVRADNSTLDAMTGTVYEIGMRSNTSLHNSSRWYWDISAYYAPIRDEILSVDDPTRPGDSLSANIDKTTHAGIEVLTGASFAFGQGFKHRIDPVISLTWNDFHFDSDEFYGDNSLPAAPDYVVRGEVLYRNANGMYAGPTFDLVGQRYADFSNTYAVGAYSLVGFRGGYARGQWQLFAELRNLTDEEYVSTVTVLNRASQDSEILYPGMPRSVFVGLRWRM
jgi:iron complex outermembrane receptor protein